MNGHNCVTFGMNSTRSFFALSAVLVLFLCSSLFAQVEDTYALVKKGEGVVKLCDGYRFTEGPIADSTGNVYFTDQPNNTIVRWSAQTGECSIFLAEAGRANGLYFDKKGQLIACADGVNQLWSIDQHGNHSVLVDKVDGKLLNGPNDVWVAPNGGIYFTDPLYKRDYWERNPEMQQKGQHVYYLTPDRTQVRPVETSLLQPNGIVGSPDGKQLYVADIGAGKTWMYTINKDGSLSKKTLFTEMGSDGMTLDQQGNLYLTGKGVTVFNKKGKQIAHIPIEADWTANVCFGGKDHNMLFITAMDAVWGLKMNVKGTR